MALEESGGYCRSCHRNVLCRRERIGCIVGALVTLLTCGLAAPFLVIYQLGAGGWRCVRCGKKL